MHVLYFYQCLVGLKLQFIPFLYSTRSRCGTVPSESFHDTWGPGDILPLQYSREHESPEEISLDNQRPQTADPAQYGLLDLFQRMENKIDVAFQKVHEKLGSLSERVLAVELMQKEIESSCVSSSVSSSPVSSHSEGKRMRRSPPELQVCSKDLLFGLKK